MLNRVVALLRALRGMSTMTETHTLRRCWRAGRWPWPRRPSAQGFDVKTHTLKNGMKILVQEDHSIPNVALYIFYRIGSRNERPGTTGISHFFEHMMFNGAKKYGPGRVRPRDGGQRRLEQRLHRARTSPSTRTGSRARRWS